MKQEGTIPENETLSGTGFVLSQELNTCAGQTYEVRFDYRFDDPAGGQCFLSAFVGPPGKQDSLYTQSSNPVDDAIRPGLWIPVQSRYTAMSTNDRLVFVVHCAGQVWNNYSFDNIELKRVGALSKA